MENKTKFILADILQGMAQESQMYGNEINFENPVCQFYPESKYSEYLKACDIIGIESTIINEGEEICEMTGVFKTASGKPAIVELASDVQFLFQNIGLESMNELNGTSSIQDALIAIESLGMESITSKMKKAGYSVKTSMKKIGELVKKAFRVIIEFFTTSEARLKSYGDTLKKHLAKMYTLSGAEDKEVKIVVGDYQTTIESLTKILSETEIKKLKADLTSASTSTEPVKALDGLVASLCGLVASSGGKEFYGSEIETKLKTTDVEALRGSISETQKEKTAKTYIDELKTSFTEETMSFSDAKTKVIGYVRDVVPSLGADIKYRKLWKDITNLIDKVIDKVGATSFKSGVYNKETDTNVTRLQLLSAFIIQHKSNLNDLYKANAEILQKLILSQARVISSAQGSSMR